MQNDISATYEEQGYVFPIRVMPEQQALDYRQQLEQIESEYKNDAEARHAIRYYSNFVLPFCHDITRREEILEPVKAMLGEDLLVWNLALWIKEPKTKDHVSWHQDLTYWGLDDADEVTAWLAMSPATIESGCMRFIPGSHKQNIVEHKDTFSKENLLSRGQEIAVEVDESQAVDVTLQPGEMSLHHGRMFHASAPNKSSDRRIGLAIRYIKTSMKQIGGEKGHAMLASGQDNYGHFELVPPPCANLDSEAMQHYRTAKTQHEKILYKGAAQQGRSK